MPPLTCNPICVPANGTLNFNNIPDNNENKAVGGHIAYFLIPGLEIGYGFETARVGTDDTEFRDVRSLNNVVDLAFVKDASSLKGRLDIRSQYIWLKVDNPDMHPLEYDNKSSAWYGQIAYQPVPLPSSYRARAACW